MSSFSPVERGTPNSESYRIYMLNENYPVSLLHDIPFAVDADKNIYNAIVLGPRWSNAKMELGMLEALNPIRQCYENEKLNYVPNCFPHHGYIWNYCILPQTWKSSILIDDGTGSTGDNLPMEAIEIGYRVGKLGEVLQVKLLGTIALKGETNWKIIVMDVNDPMASVTNDLDDIGKHFPGLLKATVEWLKVTPVADGRGDNHKPYYVEVQGSNYAQNITQQYNDLWSELIQDEDPPIGISSLNTSVMYSPFRIPCPIATVIIEESPPLSEPLPIEDIIHKWHYVDLN